MTPQDPPLLSRPSDIRLRTALALAIVADRRQAGAELAQAHARAEAAEAAAARLGRRLAALEVVASDGELPPLPLVVIAMETLEIAVRAASRAGGWGRGAEDDALAAGAALVTAGLEDSGGERGGGGGEDDDSSASAPASAPALDHRPGAGPAVAAVLVASATGCVCSIHGGGGGGDPGPDPPPTLPLKITLALVDRLLRLPALGPHILEKAAVIIKACVRGAMAEAANGAAAPRPHRRALDAALELAHAATAHLAEWMRDEDILSPSAVAACGDGVRALIGAYRAAEAARLSGVGGGAAGAADVANLTRFVAAAAISALQGDAGGGDGGDGEE